MRGFSLARLDEVEPLRLNESVSWWPVRRRLGVEAFGVNAWFARRAGDDLMVEHDETEDGHEELYFVLSGRATFTIDGEEVDAPAGTLVFVRPESRRFAVAREPDTRLLTIGAKAGAAFRPSPWESRYPAE